MTRTEAKNFAIKYTMLCNFALIIGLILTALGRTSLQIADALFIIGFLSMIISVIGNLIIYTVALLSLVGGKNKTEEE